MYRIDEPRKWFKTRLEVEDKNSFNITNVAPIEVDLRIEGENYTLDYGTITHHDDTEVSLLLDLTANSEFIVTEITPTCGCTAAKFESEGSSTRIDFRVNLSDIGVGKFVKGIYVTYLVNGSSFKKIIYIKGFIKN